MKNDTIEYRCEAGHSVHLKMDGKLADEVRARRAKNKTCEVGIGGGKVCNTPLIDIQKD
jgi:hypothetical protein